MLSEAELAYMRETQAQDRPVEASLRRRVQGTSASGGRVDTFQAPELVAIRLDGKESNAPASVLAVIGGGKPIKITMDLVEVRSGDTLEVSATEVYQVVTDGDPDRWATAQVIWAKRIKWPVRA